MDMSLLLRLQSIKYHKYLLTTNRKMTEKIEDNKLDAY